MGSTFFMKKSKKNLLEGFLSQLNSLKKNLYTGILLVFDKNKWVGSREKKRKKEEGVRQDEVLILVKSFDLSYAFGSSNGWFVVCFEAMLSNSKCCQAARKYR